MKLQRNVCMFHSFPYFCLVIDLHIWIIMDSVEARAKIARNSKFIYIMYVLFI